MSEANFWKEIKRNIGHLGHWSRIESHATSEGFPDTSLTMQGVETKIELKYGKDEVPEIRPSQVRWFRKNISNGGRPLLFVKIVDGGNTFYMLFKGKRVIDGLYKLKNVHQWFSLANYTWIDEMRWDDLGRILCSEECMSW